MRALFGLGLLILAAMSFGASPAQAGTFSTLYTFCNDGCATGGSPQAALIEDSSGNLYGTAQAGGNSQNGVAFEWVKGKSGGYRVLYTFCAKANCTDGANPYAPLIIDVHGNLYGTTYKGGTANQGIVFELVRGSHNAFRLKVLHNFCSLKNCADGSEPQTGLTYQGASAGELFDGTSPLFGATNNTAISGQGDVYELTPRTSGEGTWQVKVIHTFCSTPFNVCSDAANPSGNLVMDDAGDIYGTAATAGPNGAGAVFKLTPLTKSWKETLAYSFCALSECADGGIPDALAIDSSGTLYGTTAEGGIHNCGGGCGVIFKLVPTGKKFTYSVLYAFCPKTGCADGSDPTGAIALDTSGNIYGTTSLGGTQGDQEFGGGTVFELSGDTLQTLHNFCTSAGCGGGYFPTGGALLDKSGDIFGTTADESIIFEMSP